MWLPSPMSLPASGGLGCGGRLFVHGGGQDRRLQDLLHQARVLMHKDRAVNRAAVKGRGLNSRITRRCN